MILKESSVGVSEVSFVELKSKPLPCAHDEEAAAPQRALLEPAPPEELPLDPLLPDL